MRLLAKFSLIFVVVFGAGLGAAAYLFYGLLQRNAREQVLYNAQLMMETALAMRSYTISQVKPVIEDTQEQQRAAQSQDQGDQIFRDLCAKRGLVGKRVFRPQTVPAFAATELFAQLRKNYPDYFYKEAAPNPTNPRNRALDWEEDVIKAFKNRPDLKVFDGERDTPLGRSLFLARPLRAPKACLECHSTPGNAPPEMLKVYGTANGFGWAEGDVIAAQIVSVPVSLPLQMANQAFRQLLVSLVLVGVVTLVVLDAVLYATVIRPVSRFAARADEISKGQLDVPELEVRGKDEISILAAAFNRMHRSVTAAMKMLEGEPEAPSEQDPEPE
ncbi:MAG: signal protein [Anaeromyxobacter sp. RBG_16_69_14]|nr:MAG: signal protein [Anaeromyxobacter sp. RBG_16_69_14]